MEETYEVVTGAANGLGIARGPTTNDANWGTGR